MKRPIEVKVDTSGFDKLIANAEKLENKDLIVKTTKNKKELKKRINDKIKKELFRGLK